jgi:phage gp29-like protein
MPNPDTIQSRNGGNKIYKDMMYDPIISGLVDARKSGLTKLEIRHTQNEATDEEFAYITKYFDYIDTQKLITNAIDALFYGYAVFELIWGEYDGKQVPVDFKYWDYDLFAFGYNDNNEETLYFIGDGNETELDPYKFIVVRNGASVVNQYGNSLLSKIYWSWFFKKNIIATWVKYIEKFGIPFLYAQVDNIINMDNDSLKSEVIEQLKNMVNSSVGVLNKDVVLNTVENNNNNGVVFSEFIKWCDGNFAVNIMGHNAAASATPGSLGNNAQAEDTITRLIDGDKKLIETFFDTIIEYIYIYNFDTKKRQPDTQLYEQSSIDVNKVNRDMTLYNQGVRFTKDYIVKSYDDITLEDFEIVEQNNSLFGSNNNNIFNAKSSKSTDKENTKLIQDYENLINENDNAKYILPIINKIQYELNQCNNADEALDKLNNIYKKLKPMSADYRDYIERIINIGAIIGINAENDEV